MTDRDALDHARAFQLAGELAESLANVASKAHVAKLNAALCYTISSGYAELSKEIQNR